jgi:DNA-binding beta-propeller fold protein YncE
MPLAILQFCRDECNHIGLSLQWTQSWTIDKRIATTTNTMRYARLSAAFANLFLAALSSFSHAQGIPPRFLIETIAGNGQTGDLPEGNERALRVPIDLPFGVEVGPDGGLYATSIGQHRVLRLDLASGKLSSVAGSATKGYAGDGGQARQAQLNEPYEVRFDNDKHMVFVEMQNHLIRRVDARTGMISTVAGTGQPGYGGDDGPAAKAQFRQPHSITLDAQGNLYVADIGNHRIRRIDTKTGTISSIAGNGERELPQDGAKAQGRPILGPRALFITGRTLWVALREGNSIWRVDLDSGVIRHVAGTGSAGYSGDGGSARAATFNGPKGITATADGLVYVVDSENQAIRMIDTSADRIFTVAGLGPQARGFAGEKVLATGAKLDRPHGICLAPFGGLYLGDTNNHRVRWLHP